METIKQCYEIRSEKGIIEDIMSREDIKIKYQINYPKPSNRERILVVKHQIPMFIYEEARGDA